ncbi:MAG: patatin-like phospholipase family protein [Desulfobacteraceae bacterium]|nr:patatin-like phospholipase family protein [Desulfobacteraceae bacterium]MBC2757407.1 patatin-like phospholipase family protein [Desulfobacteraceae bacterium]
MLQATTLWAGKNAFAKIKGSGLTPDDVKVVAGAAGGPKWLILANLDRALFSQWFAGRKKPLFLIGASIGAWRFAAASQNDFLTAIDRFQHAYIHQAYETKPTPADVSRESKKILNRMMDGDGETAVLSHPYLRLNIMTVRSKGMTGQDRKSTLLPGLLLAALGNTISRKFLKIFFERALFYDARDLPPFYDMNEFPIHRVGLSPKNLKPALMASGSIPLVMAGVKDIAGAPAGLYRDGGVIDYHLDIPFLNDNSGIVLFPHFTNRIIPGWLDKQIPWRRPALPHMDNVLLITPSREFLDRLPYQKIPDRNDFYKFKGQDAQRISYWNTAVDIGANMADEFMECVENGRIRDRIRPIEEMIRRR